MIDRVETRRFYDSKILSKIDYKIYLYKVLTLGVDLRMWVS